MSDTGTEEGSAFGGNDFGVDIFVLSLEKGVGDLGRGQ